MVRAAGWALAAKETEPDAHFCAVTLNTGAGQKAATTQTMVRSKRTVALVEHKENVSVDAVRQHQAFVKVDADGNFVMPLVASLSMPEGGAEWKNEQPSGNDEVQPVA